MISDSKWSMAKAKLLQMSISLHLCDVSKPFKLYIEHFKYVRDFCCQQSKKMSFFETRCLFEDFA